MILSLFPVSKRKLPLGCLTTKNPTGTVTGLLDAPDCSALLAIVRPPELKAYIFMAAGGAVCASAMEGTTRSARATLATRARILRFIRLSSAVRNFRSEDTTRRDSICCGLLSDGTTADRRARVYEAAASVVKALTRCDKTRKVDNLHPLNIG